MLLVVRRVNDIKGYITPYVTFDAPIEYKGIKIYPIKVKDYYTFMDAYDILKIDKNNIPDVDIIQMSYLQFMYNLVVSDDIIWRTKFIEILGLCFNIYYDEEKCDDKFSPSEILSMRTNENIFRVYINGYDFYFEIENEHKIRIIINGVSFNASEFNDIKSLILYQNFEDYEDTIMSKDFKDVVEKYYDLKSRDTVPLTLENQINVVMSSTGLSLDDVMKLSLRKLQSLFDLEINKTEYMIGRFAQAQGCTAKVDHWVYKSKKSKYSDVFTDTDTFRDKYKQGLSS
jgi:hypothetical protein